jgi:Icc-related predicted phosphoesterase
MVMKKHFTQNIINKIKIVCISDTHTFHKNLNLPSGDILIHSGDFTFKGKREEIQDFNNFLQAQNFKHKIIIAGNHDLTFDEERYNKIPNEIKPKEAKEILTDCIYLENSGIELLGYKFWGSPMTPTFFNWAFMKCRGKEIDKYWKMIPSDTDVLITHGPPRGVLDKTVSGEHVGCERLFNHVVGRVKPLYHIFGHIHEGYGRFEYEVNEGRNINFLNASICNLRYSPDNDIHVFYLDKRL